MPLVFLYGFYTYFKIYITGGAIQVYNGNNIKCMYTLIGLTSFGHTDCGEPNVPGVYTRIFNYLDWIEKIVWT